MKVTTYAGIGLMFAVLAVCLFGIAGCRTFSEFVDGSATVNKTTILLAIVVSAGVAGLITGFLGILAGAGSGAAMTWLSTTTSTQPDAFQVPSAPWYLDPMAFLRPILTWLSIAVAVGLFFERSRQHTAAFLKATLTGHPIRGFRRFLAGMGWRHSDEAT